MIPAIEQAKQMWQGSLTADAGPLYLAHGGLFLEGQFHHGAASIGPPLEAWRTTSGDIRKVRTEAAAAHGPQHYFEMGQYRLGNQERHAYVIAWKKVDDQWLREFEVIDPKTTGSTVPPGITQARTKWVELSNAHDHGKLVEEIYTADAIYFNNGQVDQGTLPISQRYAYMSSPNWHISLHPIHVMPVQDDLCYEIGKYVSNGEGHYLLIWQKQVDGHWQALLDFNF